MTTNKVWKESHGAFENVLIPITMFDGAFEFELGIEKDLSSYVEILKAKVPHLIEDIYFIPNQVFSHFIYEKKFVQVDIQSLEWSVWEMFHTQERIEYWINTMKEYEKENDYENIFSSMEKRILIPNFIRYFYDIPEEQRYNCFRDLYRRSEYGFYMFEYEFLEEVFECRSYSQEHKDQLDEFYKEIANQEIVTVYRGVTNRSTPADEAISWTLDIKVADFFAKRFNSNGSVYKAQINKKDVYDYLTGRNEKEVLLNPYELYNIEKIN